jgi:hypothetical protein
LTYSQEVSESQSANNDTYPLILAQSKEEIGRINSNTLDKEASETISSDIDSKCLTWEKLLSKENQSEGYE